MPSLKRNSAVLCAFIAFIILIVISQLSSNTYDTGDSITHYLESRYSWQVHYYFIYNWAKPVFVLLSSPFAQFGFSGIKVFQAIVWAFVIYFTVGTASLLKLRYPWLLVLILLAMPHTVLSTSSGLTEPLFAALLIAGIYYYTRHSNVVATILFSFLLYARSEAQVVDIIVITYLIFSRKWKYIPLLGTSLIIYGIAGLMLGHDFFWYFTENPYDRTQGTYGYGKWVDYFNDMHRLAGLPVSLLSIIAIVYLIAIFVGKVFYRRNIIYFNEIFFLIYGIAIGFFVFQEVAWINGLFASFGMGRVLICIFPLIAIMAYQALLFLCNLLTRVSKRLVPSFFALAIFTIIIFPFLDQRSGYGFPKNFEPDPSYYPYEDAINWLRDQNMLGSNICYSNPIGSLLLPDSDVYSRKRGLPVFDDPKKLWSGSIYIWDQWFSVVEKKAPLDSLTIDNKFTILNCFENKETNYKVCVLRCNR